MSTDSASTKKIRLFKHVSMLLVFIVICMGAAGLGAIATTPEIGGWYQTLNKPTWNPPSWIFAPVWTALYLMMAVAAWDVWRSADFAKTKFAMTIFAVQLILNIAWSWIFFRWHQIGWAMFEIVALWATILATIFVFLRFSRLSAALLIPYLAWVSFASVLNFWFWRLN